MSSSKVSCCHPKRQRVCVEVAYCNTEVSPPPPPDYSILSFLRHIIITLSDEIERTLTNEACISAGPSQQHSGSLWIFENPPRVTRIFGGS